MLVILFTHNPLIQATMTTGAVTIAIITDNITTREPVNFASDKQPYVAGGTTFNYPAGLFTQTPTIRLAVEVAPHADTTTYTLEISANDALSSTVMAYKITGGIVTEAATNEVTIHFIAAGM